MGLISNRTTTWLRCCLVPILLLVSTQSAQARPSEWLRLSKPPRLLEAVNPNVAKTPAMNVDFPDPTIVQDGNGIWYAFATNGKGKNVQAATAPSPAGPWTYRNDLDLLPDAGAWTSGANTWAPDVRQVADGSWVMYYSGELADDRSKHCIGVATSKRGIAGPYTAAKEPLRCHLDKGGAIDPAGFVDPATGRRYVVYKIDGNSIGGGGDCNNGVEPLAATPLMLQELAADGVTPRGDPVEILDRRADDGPLVEAPNIVRATDGSYVLFFSSHCYNSPRYNVNYAIADRVDGPYVRTSAPLLETGDYATTAPGGATATVAGGYLAFHANCPQGRCMFVGQFGVLGGNVIVS